MSVGRVAPEAHTGRKAAARQFPGRAVDATTRDVLVRRVLAHRCGGSRRSGDQQPGECHHRRGRSGFARPGDDAGVGVGQAAATAATGARPKAEQPCAAGPATAATTEAAATAATAGVDTVPVVLPVRRCSARRCAGGPGAPAVDTGTGLARLRAEPARATTATGVAADTVVSTDSATATTDQIGPTHRRARGTDVARAATATPAEESPASAHAFALATAAAGTAQAAATPARVGAVGVRRRPVAADIDLELRGAAGNLQVADELVRSLGAAHATPRPTGDGHPHRVDARRYGPCERAGGEVVLASPRARGVRWRGRVRREGDRRRCEHGNRSMVS